VRALQGSSMTAQDAVQARHARERRGFALGALGVCIFALTLPMTRLAVGDASDPQLPPAFVTAGRAALAGLLSVAWLRTVGASRPAREHWRSLAICALGTVLGFPLFLALALRHVDAMHAAVVTGVLPLGTAVAAAVWLRQRASRGFWLCAVTGCALVLAFAALRGHGSLSVADGLLLLAVASASVGYVAGARVSAKLPAEQVICWVLVLSLPLTLPAMLATWPTDAGAVGCLATFMLVVGARRMTWERLRRAGLATLEISSMILLLVTASNLFGAVFSRLGSANFLAQMLTNLALPPMLMLVVILALIFVLGWPLEWVPIVLIVVPIALPIVTAAGIDLIWFCTLVAVTLQTAWLSPPVALSAYFLKGVVPQWDLKDIYAGMVQFMVLQLLAVGIVMLFPKLATWLPSVN